MSSPCQKAAVKTLAYADVFDWPLRSEEIWKWLIECNNATMQQCRRALRSLGIISKKGGLYFLKGRENITKLRQQREKWSKGKIKIARQIILFLKWIPTVRMVGITGALATNNVKEDDDIDLLVITSSGSLWTTRLLVTLLVDVLGIRRHPHEREVNNKICLNMFLDEDYLTVPKKEQDLFSAHEVVQMKPLYDKGKIYQKFLRANQWIERFLPNAISIKYKVSSIKYKNNSLLHYYVITLLSFVEVLLRNLQLWYMRRRRTTEKIGNGIIRFHPQDAREWVFKTYRQKLFRYSP